jgi:hypothetical protein
MACITSARPISALAGASCVLYTCSHRNSNKKTKYYDVDEKTDKIYVKFIHVPSPGRGFCTRGDYQSYKTAEKLGYIVGIMSIHEIKQDPMPCAT